MRFALVVALGTAGCAAASPSADTIEADCLRLRSTELFCDPFCEATVDLSPCRAELAAIPAADYAALEDCVDSPCPSENWCFDSWYTCPCIAACAQANTPALQAAYARYWRCWADRVGACR